MSNKEMERLLKAAGFVRIRQSKHTLYKDAQGTLVTLPTAKKELSPRLEKQILVQIRKHRMIHYS